MDDIQMVVDEFLLDRSVISLNNAVDFRASRIDKQMGDIGFSQGCIKLPEIL